MRIITGSARGRRLKSLRGRRLRPTSDFVKECIFGTIGSAVDGATVLDLYAGTGNLGLEALSRGARAAVFVEHHAPAARLIRENARSLGLEQMTTVRRGHALRVLGRLGVHRFDLVFADPPYRHRAGTAVVAAVARNAILAPGGLLVLEHQRQEALPLRVGDLARVKEKRTGDTAVTFFRRESPGPDRGDL
jgi:16S rRNA (guanine(966)-N(2))-methyltransferase RsmD